MNTTMILAQAADQQGGSGMQAMITIGLIFVIFYFLAIRPQQKQAKQQKQLHEGLKVGDKVVTAGGIFGIIREVQDKTVKLEIAPNTIIKIAKNSIAANVAKDGTAEEKK